IPLYSKLITEVATEIPRCLSISMKSLVACFLILLLFTAPAVCIAPPNNRNFSVRVVLPASGWEMIAKVFRLLISLIYFIISSRKGKIWQFNMVLKWDDLHLSSGLIRLKD